MFFSDRAMAIGDSITRDTTSVNQNGYRGDISLVLPSLTWVGRMISGGSLCEAYPGERISEVRARLSDAFRSTSSVGITITLLGTNNAAQGQNGATAISEYDDYLTTLVGLSPFSRNIILSTLNTSDGAGVGQVCIDALNAALPGLCSAHTRCTFVDVRPFLVQADYADTYHLVQSGYSAITPAIIAAIQALT